MPFLPVSFLAPAYCKHPYNPADPAEARQFKFRLSGKTLNLAGFGYPTAGIILAYETLPSGGVPFCPHDSTGALLTDAEPVDFDAMNPGSWSYESDYYDSDETTPTPIINFVLWLQYANFTSVHTSVDFLEVKVLTRAQVNALLNNC